MLSLNSESKGVLGLLMVFGGGAGKESDGIFRWGGIGGMCRGEKYIRCIE